MIGNDIIDRQETKLSTNWERKGFLQKVFTANEQNVIEHASNKFNAVWRLWSMKESAYKLILQAGYARFLNPKKLACEIVSPKDGVVTIDNYSMSTYSEINHHYICSTAVLDPSLSMYSQIIPLQQNDAAFQSATSRHYLINYIAQQNDLDSTKIKFLKSNNGVPELFYNGQKIHVHFSLSHHGSYAALSILNN